MYNNLLVEIILVADTGNDIKHTKTELEIYDHVCHLVNHNLSRQNLSQKQ